jgi:allantoinase
VLIEDGHVEAILAPDAVQPADQTLDATGLHVLPGVVDAHVHFNEPGRTEWEGFLTGTTAAAAGGVTTVCDMPLNSHPPTLDARAFALKRAAVGNHALVDYALWGGVVPESIARVAELQHAGAIGVKGFMCDSGIADFPPIDEFCLAEALQHAAELDQAFVVALHAEDAAETVRLGDQARSQGRVQPRDWAICRPPSTELDAVRVALESAGDTGARVHFVHISTPAAARAISEARAGGIDVSVETCPHYLLLDETELDRLGAFAKCAPPLRSRSEVEQLCHGMIVV